jgi:hypothetical protein
MLQCTSSTIIIDLKNEKKIYEFKQSTIQKFHVAFIMNVCTYQAHIFINSKVCIGFYFKYNSR